MSVKNRMGRIQPGAITRLSRLLLGLMLVLGLSVTWAVAQEGDDGGDRERERPDRRERGERDRRDRDRGEIMQERIFKHLLADIELTDEQENRVKAIIEEHGQQMAEWREANQEQFRELRQQMREAHRADDKEQVKALREQARGLMEDRPDPREMVGDIEAVLTDEQKAQLAQNREAIREKMRGRRGHDAKKAKDDKARRPAAGKFRDAMQSHFAMQRLMDEIDLSEAQHQQLGAAIEARMEKQHAWAEDNREKMQSIGEQMREARDAGDREQMRELGQQMREIAASRPAGNVLGEAIQQVLTDEQQQKLEQLQEERMQQMRERMEQRRGDNGERGNRRERKRERPQRDRDRDDDNNNDDE